MRLINLLLCYAIGGMLALSLLGGFTGCAPKGQGGDSVVPGDTTVEELKKQKGEPVSQYVPQTRAVAKVLEYPDGVGYQVEKDRVVSSYRDPHDDEKTLQYWKHKFRGHAQVYRELPEMKDVHGNAVYEFSAKSLGTTVIYDGRLDRVTKVVSYGKN